MQFLKSESPISLPALFNGLAILIFSMLALVVPSGYSYGPVLLVLGSSILLFKRNQFQLNRQDHIFIFILLLYFFVHVCLNIVFSLPARSYDGLMRFLLVIPVYLLLIAYPPRPIYFWAGLIMGTLGAGFFAIFQKYFSNVTVERANGYINAIQFGDISLLMASLMLCGFVWAIYFYKNTYLASLFFVSSLFGFTASFLSISRGGWIAIPFVLYVIFSIIKPFSKKIFLVAIFFSCIAVSSLFVFLPKTNILVERITQTRLDLINYFQGDSDSSSTSFNTRIQMWKNGIDAFKDRPIAGWGDISAIKSHYPSQWEALNSIDDFNHLHNEYLDALAKHGLLGFLALMILYLAPLMYFLKLMRNKNEEHSIFAAAGAILIFCVMTFGLTQTFMAHISGVTIFSFYLVIIKAYCRNLTP
jgi:O-antigen ligase